MADARVLVVDDDDAMVETLARSLRKRGFEVQCATSGSAALAILGHFDAEVMMSDLTMRPMGGLDLCERARAIRPDLPVVLLTAFGSMETAVEALRRGAYDFLTKPVEMDVAEHALRRAVERTQLGRELARLREELDSTADAEIVGDSAAVRELLEMIARVAPSSATVLVTGESGVGKELAARALHRMSTRSEGPFIGLNCAAVPESLLESELFGHVKGAFTDARGDRAGVFVESSGGTLFLDEVGEMPAPMQAKLLRALQERRVRPVGSDKEVPFDSRIVAATNRDLLGMVERGELREDLYFRLAVIELEVPALRERGRDVLLIARRLLEDAATRCDKAVVGFDDEAARLLLRYRWPGNVRELANCVERAVALARFDHVTVDDLPPRLRGFEPQRDVLVTAEDPTELVTLEEVERRYILRVLDLVRGRRARAAEILGVDRKTLYRKLERWGHPDDPE